MKLALGISLALLSGTGIEGLPYTDASWAWALISGSLPPSLASLSMHPLVISPGLNYILTEELVPTYILFPHILGEVCSRVFHPGDTRFYFHARVA